MEENRIGRNLQKLKLGGRKLKKKPAKMKNRWKKMKLKGTCKN